MSKLRKPASILLSVIMVLSLFAIVPFGVSAADGSVTFIDRTWTPDPDNPAGTLSSSEQTARDTISLTDAVTEWSGGNYYVLNSDVTFYKTITVTDNAYLILCNGCTLKSSYGIYVKDGAHLTIYGQEGDEGRMDVSNANGAAIGGWDDKVGGTVTIKGGYFDLRGGSKDAAIGGGRAPSGFNGINIYGGKIYATGGYGAAAIGGGRKNNNSKCGPIKIYGGFIRPTGGKYAAAIGGGDDMNGGDIEINGGEIRTYTNLNDYNKYGAAIGGGNDGDGGTITINGGNIHVVGGSRAAGIGGGDGGDGGKITINGGNIGAIGSEIERVDYEPGAGIGGGNNGDSGTIVINGGNVDAEGAKLSAGIGGGNNGDGENITINGGNVNARGGPYGAGIGGGEDGDNGSITINDGYVKAVGGEQGAGIGTGNNNATDGKIRINGGTVLAVSDKGAAIGSGDDGDLEESIYITGGSVYARSGIYLLKYTYEDFNWLTPYSINSLRADENDHYCGAAIGAGAFANQDATIYISGGDVHAFGGDIIFSHTSESKASGAAIGAGSEEDRDFNDGGEGGDVVITGGTVEAKGGHDSSTIGHGWHGSRDGDLTLPANYSVYDCDNGVYAKASKRVELCHKRQRHILIAPCEHPVEQRYFTLDNATQETKHTRHCKCCYYSAEEDHYGDPCACAFTNGMVDVKLVDVRNQSTTVSVPYGSEYVLPEGEDYTTRDYVNMFDGWMSFSNGAIYEPGDSVTVTDNITFKATFMRSYYVKTANGIEHGSVITDKTLAKPGENVTVSVEAEKGYTVDNVTAEFISLTDDPSETVTLEANDDGDYPIIMRNGSVTLSATFKRIPHEHDGISFEPYEGNEIGPGAGTWYLLEDTDLWSVLLEAGQTLNICLNGHKLDITYEEGLTVAEGATLNIYDDTDHGIVTGKAAIKVYGTFNLYGGTLRGFKDGAVRNFNNFNMYGGSITGNTSSDHGAGVYNAPSSAGFSIKGDVIIKNNTCTADGEDVEENVYLSDGKAIYVEDNLGEKTEIGITAAQPDSAANVVNNLSDNGTLSNFFSDDESYYLISSGNGAALSTYKDGMGVHLVGHSISLDGDIAVNFYMDLSQDVIGSQNDPYMLFTIPETSSEYQTQRVYLNRNGDDTRTVAYNIPDTSYYVFKCRVPAKDMESVITAQMSVGTEKGDEYTYSVKQYANYLLAHRTEDPDWEEAVPLVQAMMAYGDQAKVYFNESNTEDVNQVAFDNQIPEDEYTYSYTGIGDSVFDGATLSLKSQTTLSLYFTSSKELTLSMSGKTEGVDYDLQNVDNEYVIRIRNIAVKDLDEPIEVNVSYEGNGGTVTYSPLRYCYLAANGENSSNKLKNAVNALYNYYLAAKAYFSDNNSQSGGGE